MGWFVDFKCKFCNYEENNIGIGHGEMEYPFLTLFRCDNCKTVGSTWIYEDKIPLCSHCYHAAISILSDGTTKLNCPRCAATGTDNIQGRKLGIALYLCILRLSLSRYGLYRIES